MGADWLDFRVHGLMTWMLLFLEGDFSNIEFRVAAVRLLFLIFWRGLFEFWCFFFGAEACRFRKGIWAGP